MLSDAGFMITNGTVEWLDFIARPEEACQRVFSEEARLWIRGCAGGDIYLYPIEQIAPPNYSVDQIEKWLLVSGVTLFSIKEEWFLGAPRWKSKQLPANGGESYPIIEVEL